MIVCQFIIIRIIVQLIILEYFFFVCKWSGVRVLEVRLVDTGWESRFVVSLQKFGYFFVSGGVLLGSCLFSQCFIFLIRVVRGFVKVGFVWVYSFFWLRGFFLNQCLIKFLFIRFICQVCIQSFILVGVLGVFECFIFYLQIVFVF